MDRSLHFSLSVLEQFHHSKDWRRGIISSYPEVITAVYVDTKDISSLLNGNAIDDEGTINSVIKTYYKPTKEQAQILEDGGKCDDELLNRLHELYMLRECIGKERFLYINNINPHLFYNSVFFRDSRDEYYSLRKKGIEVCNINSEMGLDELTANWFDPSDPQGEDDFSWSSFLCHPLPPSNSAVIADRYLFDSGRNNYSINNLSDLLKAIIPDSYEGQYNVTCLFETESIGDDIEKSLHYINKGVRRNLTSLLEGNKLKLNMNFIAVDKAPKKKKGDNDDPKLSAWQNLDYLIHDRCVYTNYYLITASGDVKVSGSYGHAYRWQVIEYKAFLNGIDNRFQNPRSIPLIIEEKFFYKLFSFIKAAPSDHYRCYSYNYDERRIAESPNKELSIKNNLVSFKSKVD